MGLYGWNLLFPYCVFAGLLIPLACCYYGDRVVGIPFKVGFALELPVRDEPAPAPATIETTSAPFKEYDEPPVVTRLPSDLSSNITKTYLPVPVEELVVRRVVRRVVLLFMRLVATRDDRVDDRVEGNHRWKTVYIKTAYSRCYGARTSGRSPSVWLVVTH